MQLNDLDDDNVFKHASVSSTYPGPSVRKYVGILVIFSDVHSDMVADMEVDKVAKCIGPKLFFDEKFTRLACLLSFASLFLLLRFENIVMKDMSLRVMMRLNLQVKTKDDTNWCSFLGEKVN